LRLFVRTSAFAAHFQISVGLGVENCNDYLHCCEAA
jgi:hypothetical protein